MKNFVRILCALLLAWGCDEVPDPAEKAYYISSISEYNGPGKQACSFRYRIDNSFSRLDNQLQQKAVRSAFDLWQKADPNILFLQKQDAITTELIVRFEGVSEQQKDSQKSGFGLIRGNVSTLSSSRLEANTYIISLDADFEWDTNSLTRVIAYHIGRFLGMKDSNENSSVLNRIYVDQTIRLSDNDSTQLNALYSKPCLGDCNNFLPLSVNVPGPVTKSIRIDKPGKISISSSGSMVVGFWLGWSTPFGLEKGLFSFPIGDYSIDRSMNHAALLYKVNNETNWRLCGTACEFETDGISQCVDLTLGINDLDLTDNKGAYQVVVNYKK